MTSSAPPTPMCHAGAEAVKALVLQSPETMQAAAEALRGNGWVVYGPDDATWTHGIAGDGLAAGYGPVLGQVLECVPGKMSAWVGEENIGTFGTRYEARAAVEAALRETGK